MTAQSIVLDCVKRGIMLWGEEGELCLRAPQGALTPELRSALKLHKTAVLRLLGDWKQHSIASYEQQRLWFLSQLDEDSAAYAMEFVIQLDGQLKKDAFAAALENIVLRHEPLRTTFKTIAGEMVQVVHNTMHTPIDTVDLRSNTSASRSEAIAEIVDVMAMQPFDLATGPLLRTTLILESDTSHVLVLTMHHIAADGWSLGVFFRELSSYYNRAVAGNTAALPDLQLRYTDYSRNQRLNSGKDNVDLGYWRDKLTPLPPRLDLKAIGGVVATEQPAGLMLHVLDAKTTQRFSSWCRENDVTQFTALLAIFAGLLHRYSSQTSFTIGVPVAGRRMQGAEELVGFFVNMLAIRCECDGNQSFSAHIHRFKRDVLEALEHQDLPFARLVEALQPERNSDDAPLFQVGFSMQNFAAINLEMSGITARILKRSIADAKYALCLFARERDGKLHLRLEYRGDVLNEVNAQRMLQHFERLLKGVIADADVRLGDCTLLSESERERLIVTFNQTGAPYERDATVHECFETQVRERPDAVAVIDGGRQYTFKEIDRWANGIAQWLQNHGVDAEARVGILAERNAAMVAAVLGVLKAGGAYLPLDSAFPQRRLMELLEDGGAVSVIADSSLASMLGQDVRPRLMLERDGANLQTDAAPATSANANSLAYVMYTSGSTGMPKGVCVEHRNIVRLVKQVNFGTLDSQTVGLVYAPLAFDASTIEMFGPLLNGGCIVLQAPGGASVEELATTIAENGVNTLWLTAGLFHQMAENGPLHKLKGLRQLLSGGDVMQANSVRRVMNALPACVLINGYGPTEATTLAVAHAMRSDQCINDTVPIGKPLQNTRAYVLDESLQPLPIGVPGDLYIGGDAIARGYLNRPELTAERFMCDPFSAAPGARMYRTGDRARWTEDGLLEFLGRNDGQVKLRGYRIELGEIENALCHHPCVSQAAAAVKKRGIDKVLVAYVVPTNRHELNLDVLRAHLRERLPAFMAPAMFIPLESIPLTPNGKVDRANLPEPDSRDQGAIAGSSEHVAPRNEIEARAVCLFEAVLGIKGPSVCANFFDLGGHSLMATQLVSRVREEFNVEISLRDFFHKPTIESLGSAVAAASASDFDGGIHRQSLSLEEQLDALDCVASGVRAS